MHSPQKWLNQKMVPSESAIQELSNEWSCRYASTILILLDNFCVLHLVTEVTTIHGIIHVIQPVGFNHLYFLGDNFCVPALVTDMTDVTISP
jgi:hypothetical protein